MNIFNGKKILILKKKKHSQYYEDILEGIITYGKPNKVLSIEFDSDSNVITLNKKLKKKIIDYKVNIFLCFSYYFIDPELLKQIYKKIILIRFEGDDMAIFDHYSKWYAQFFDINITTNLSTHKKYKNLNYNSICHAMPSLSKSLIKINYPSQSGISFVGQSLPTVRKKYIDAILNNGFSVNIFGEGSSNGTISEDEKFKVFSYSKINLSFSTVLPFSFTDILNKNSINNKKRQTVGRVFEIISVGGFVLTEDSDSLKHFFIPGEHLDVFKNEKELLEKIKYYLKNDRVRVRIAKNGKKYFNKKYKHSKYFPELIRVISSIKIKKRLLDGYEWPISLKNFNTQFIRFKYLLNIEYFIYMCRYSNMSFYLKSKILRHFKK